MLTPNIDRRGRIARAISGALCLAAAVAMLVFAWPASGAVRWPVALLLAVFGGFQLFEARKSWCVMRACGFKTPM